MGRGHYEGGEGYVDPNAKYRDIYKLRHLRAIQAAIARLKAEKMSDKLEPEKREYLDRAGRVFGGALTTAQAAGVLEGGTVGETAAEAVNKILHKGYSEFPGTRFIEVLRDADLAPKADIGASKTRSYHQSYDRRDIEKIRAFLRDMLAGDKGFDHEGKPKSLDWDEKQYLVEALKELDGLMEKHYPSGEQKDEGPSTGQLVKALGEALAGDDAQAVSEARKALEDAFEKEPIKDRFLAELEKAREAHKTDADLQLWIAGFVADRLETLHPEGVEEVLSEAVESLRTDLELHSKAISKLLETAERLDTAGLDVPEELTEILQEEINEGADSVLTQMQSLLEKAEDVLEKLNKRLAEHRVLKGDDIRDVMKLYHLRQLRSAVADAVEAARGSEDVDQAKLETLSKQADAALELLHEAGEATGVPDGGSLEERVADEMNEVLWAGHLKFPGRVFLKAAAAAGLIPDSSVGENELPGSYSLEQVLKIRAFYRGILDSGQVWDINDKLTDMKEADAQHLVKALEDIDTLIEKHFPGKVPVADASLGRMLEALMSADSGSRAGIEAAIAAKLESAVEGGYFLELLQAGQLRHEDDLDTQSRILGYLLEALAGERGSALSRESLASTIWHKAYAALAEAGRGDEAWKLAAEALNGPGVSQDMRDLFRTNIQAEAQDIADRAQAEFPGLEDEFVEKGLRNSENKAHTKVYKLKHLDALRSLIQEKIAEAAKAGKLNEEQKALQELAAKRLSFLRELAPEAGMLPGDTPGELVAPKVNESLHGLYMKFPGQSFVLALREAGLAPAGDTIDKELTYRQSYTPAQLQELEAFLQEIIDSNQGWDYSNKRDKLEPAEKEAIEEAIKTIREQRENYPGAEKKAGRTPALHAVAPMFIGGLGIESLLGSVTGMGGLIGLSLAGLAVLFSFIFGFRYLAKRARRQTDEEARPKRFGPSADVLARYKKVEMTARKMATAVTAGQFRSRLVGEGGTDFAEFAEYQGGDRKAINWKASAKRDQLLVNRFEQSKDMPLVLMIDLSDSSQFGTRGTDKRTVVEEVASVLALAAAHKNVRVGALIFTDRVEEYIPPMGGTRHAWRIVRRLMELEPKGKETDLKIPLDFAFKELRSRAMVAMVSDFIAPDFQRPMTALAKRHDFRPIRITDPAEMRPLPDVGLLRIRDAETGGEREVDTSHPAFRTEQSAMIRGRERKIEKAFSASRTRPITLSTDEEYLDGLLTEIQKPSRR